MLKPIVVAGVCIFLVMVAIKDGRVPRAIGLTGSCKVAQTFSDSSELAVCRGGKLRGEPNLLHQGCRSVLVTAKHEYWLCPPGFGKRNASR